MNLDWTVEGRHILCCALMSAGWLALSQQAPAVEVDAELVLLVDITGSVSNSEFDQILEAYAAGFESGEILDAIQAGETGSIAASLVFYSHRNRQTIGVSWMEISDFQSAQDFADEIRDLALNRPLRQLPTGVAGALDFAVDLFGNETGGTGLGNGFESNVQAISFAGEGVDDHARRTNGSRELTVQNARDGAMSSGVDFINAITIGAPGSVDDYFAQNVIGGEVGGTAATVANVSDYSNFTPDLAPHLRNTIAAIVPEPDMVVLLAVCSLFGLYRRRQP